MLTNNDYTLIKSVYDMAGNMIKSLIKVAGPRLTSGTRTLVKDELITYAIELEHIKIQLGKILDGTVEY